MRDSMEILERLPDIFASIMLCVVVYHAAAAGIAALRRTYERERIGAGVNDVRGPYG